MGLGRGHVRTGIGGDSWTAPGVHAGSPGQRILSATGQVRSPRIADSFPSCLANLGPRPRSWRHLLRMDVRPPRAGADAESGATLVYAARCVLHAQAGPLSPPPSHISAALATPSIASAGGMLLPDDAASRSLLQTSERDRQDTYLCMPIRTAGSAPGTCF